ncbi:FkbM family methyltransferase [Actinoplanes sp. NBC_00393]|uniref:FkbM family methyltransferase n=1 Tax=Actinoplanes sp. NBC_00393 TaxID=2975953 RepID=UPI002E1EE451
MLISEVLPFIGEFRELVDVTPEAAGLSRHLGVPERFQQQRHSLAEAEKLELGPGSLLIALVSDETSELSAVLRQMKPGARALLLTAWPAAEPLPRGLLGPLADSCCQVAAALLIDEASRLGVHYALVVERVDVHLPEVPAADDDREARITELRQLAVKRARQLAKTRKQLAAIQASTSYKAGRVLVEGGKHPAKAVVSVPAGLARLWRERRAGVPVQPEPQPEPTPPIPKPKPKPPPPKPAPPQPRVVPIALPSASPDRAQAAARITMTAPARMLVPRKLAESGLAAYEPSAMACFLAALDVAGPGEVLDIGANVGIYAAVASALTNRRVRAFEPAPELAGVAQQVATDNSLGYTVESLALGAENGTATFYMSDSSDTSNSLAEGFRESSEQLQVTVETLDSYAARTGVVPAVMKVDTETTEPDVLAGGAATILEHRPWILCEVLAGRGEDRLAAVMAQFGYHWFHVTSEVPYQERTEIEGDRTYEHLMWLFTPEVPDERFWAAVRTRTVDLEQCTPS